ncbi:hypothetical protein P308_23960 [Pseudomonas piscis]|nr:hypothetical protein P308_23960 [Pseudomonas piscis]
MGSGFQGGRLGSTFNEDSLKQLLAADGGAWAKVAWQGLPAFSPATE